MNQTQGGPTWLLGVAVALAVGAISLVTFTHRAADERAASATPTPVPVATTVPTRVTFVTITVTVTPLAGTPS